MSATGESEPTRVLVVEDDPELRELLALSLRLESYHVFEARDGLDALDRLRCGARPAVILLDLIMPRMDGRQFLTAMRREDEFAAIPVVLVTGTPPPDLVGKVAEIMKKPVGIEELVACIRRRVVGDSGYTQQALC